jgi:epoxide hydrolase 4
MSEQQHRFAKVNGISIHYVIQGKGPRLVVLLHGWPEFWYSWRYQLPVLSEEYTVIAPDLRGFNLSDKPKGVENYQTKEVIKDIAALIRHVGFESAAIVGHDWGGAVAWHFATAYPEMTEQLAILNCPHPKIMMQHMLKNPRQVMKSWYILSFQIPFLPEFIVDNLLKTIYLNNVRGWMHHPENMTDKDIDAYVQAFREKDAIASSIGYYRAGLQKGFAKNLMNEKVTVPVRIIWGRDDKALGAEMNDDLHTVISGPYDIKYLDNCSHWTQIDQPEAVNDLLLDFLGKYR